MSVSTQSNQDSGMTEAPRTTAVLRGLGAALPDRVVTNEELSRRVNTSDEWIVQRTGIRQRSWAGPGTTTGDLAVQAGERALKSVSGFGPGIDLVVLATTTPDHPCPATAPEVASRLGLGNAAAYDIAAVCSGFVYALSAASNAIRSGSARRVLVIAAEVYSTILDPEDRTTSVIFGDGAGAVVLDAGTHEDPGAVLGFDLGSDGVHRDLITVPGGGARQRSTGLPPSARDHYFKMRGTEVFKTAIGRMTGSSRVVMNQVGWAPESVDWFVGHQANLRILNAVADELGIDRARAVVNLDKVGNTSAASIPLALADAVDSGRMTPGDRVLLTAFGGGLTWGAAALTWPDITSP